MKKSTLTALAGGALALSLLAAGGAWATGPRSNGDDQPDSAAIAQARISLADAAQAAERHAGGRAYEAGIEEEHGALFYEVEVASASGAQEVRVDAQTGAVLQASAADADHDEDGDED
jgi:uncharacterized membrane protein YkoI